MRAGPSQDEIRKHNLGALLRHVHLHGATSRAELTATLGLNRSTIGALTADLVAAGLVREGAPRETGRAGRPSLTVQPESQRVYAYAYSIEADQLRAARIGLGGVMLEQRAVTRPPGRPGPASVPVLVDLIVDLNAQLRRSEPENAVYVGAGVSVRDLPCRVDDPPCPSARTGRDTESLRTALAAGLGGDRPVQVGDAAGLCALAEHARGAAIGCESLIYLHSDVGVDAGIIVNGRRLTGSGGHAGTVGHMVVNPGGLTCACGSTGCWETEIGAYALLRAAGRDIADGRGAGRDTTLAVIDAARRGDARAQAALRQVGDWLGFGVANLINIFNPDMVIFGGTLREVYLAAAARVRSRLNSMAIPDAREQVRLRTPELGADGALIGAAELAFERLLADPLEGGRPSALVTVPGAPQRGV